MASATDTYMEGQDPFADWLKQSVRRENLAHSIRPEVYDDYRGFLKENYPGRTPMNSHEFTNRVKRLEGVYTNYPDTGKTVLCRRKRGYLGLELRSGEQLDLALNGQKDS